MNKTLVLRNDLCDKINALAESDNRTFSNVCETIMMVFFNQNPNVKTIAETKVKHQILSAFLTKYNDELLDRWTSGSKQDFTEFVEDFLLKNNIEFPLSPYKYTDEDMKSFADWCRVALLNSEYSITKITKHLHDWKALSKK